MCLVLLLCYTWANVVRCLLPVPPVVWVCSIRRRVNTIVWCRVGASLSMWVPLSRIAGITVPSLTRLPASATALTLLVFPVPYMHAYHG